MPNDGVAKTFTFWGMVGVVTTALKFKEHWNDYQELSQEEGRIALDDTPTHAPAMGQLDTDIPAARLKRKRSKQCCVCCGMNCGLFWKAFGIVLGIFMLWNIGKLVIWALTPAPTGLDHMPEYSVSLGCIAPAASHLYNSSSKLTYTIPMNSDHEHTLDIRGAAVGTLVLSPYPTEASGQTGIKYEISIRTDDEVLFDYLEVGSADDGSKFTLKSPIPSLMPQHVTSCMRYDMTLFIPQSLRDLEIKTGAPAHIKFADVPEIATLDSLKIGMFSMAAEVGENLLFPNMHIQAKDYGLEVYTGWIAGDVPVVESTSLSTRRGNGVLNARIHPVAVSADDDEDDDDFPQMPAAMLHTHTGHGRTDITYLQGSVHRPINSKHESQSNGDIYLTYKESGFNGPVSFQAKSYSMRNVQGGIGQDKNDRWVGNKDGEDRLVVKSDLGWVGLYF
ncbi:hypothetical protein NEOLEDRAFT_1155521 [Neolentinus lepideus HHB14362 ss-1]|uniref:Uncharacterized protein n=1 Tax=Neolentinus lepideus HHB14362 ss-1 TaxID=1314782 RepID=A0A165TJS8_9AGAM|nr:hypothetical protein NEOLEDRAFT_1155521 [Neolentinus lepideus HHB14362 ss-1]